MATYHVHHFPSPSVSNGVLVNVKQTSNSITLIGTENEEKYAKKMGKRVLSGCKDKNYEGTLDEREAVLNWALLGHLTDQKFHSLVHRLETTATLVPEKYIQLSFRIRDGDYTRLFGTIELHHDESDEMLDLYDWTAIAAKSTRANLNRCSELSVALGAKDRDLELLRQQLDDLASAKKRHEQDMLEKFRLLLNSKKLKIRDQQRLLAETDGPANDSTISRARREKDSAIPHRVRSKRKASNEIDDESSDGFEPIKQESNDDDEMHGLHTPEASEPETEDEDTVLGSRSTKFGETKLSPDASGTTKAHDDSATMNNQGRDQTDGMDDDETDDEL